jgi:hypothetical protein
MMTKSVYRDGSNELRGIPSQSKEDFLSMLNKEMNLALLLGILGHGEGGADHVVSQRLKHQ